MLKKLFKKSKSGLRKLKNGVKALHVFDLFRIYFSKRKRECPYHIYSPWFHKKIRLRPNTTDLSVLEAVVAGYHVPEHTVFPVMNAITIVDLGSNIGLTLLDFKRLYPSARIYGVEMDVDNFEMAKKNCEGEEGIDIIHAAISCTDGWVQYNKTLEAYAYSICSPAATEHGLVKVQSLSMRSLLKKLNIERIDYLKVDIEGTEYDLFTSPKEDMTWLNSVQQLNVEYHKGTPEAIIHSLEQHGFRVEFSKTHWSSIVAYRH